jgi:hypothetical protein
MSLTVAAVASPAFSFMSGTSNAGSMRPAVGVGLANCYTDSSQLCAFRELD